MALRKTWTERRKSARCSCWLRAAGCRKEAQEGSERREPRVEDLWAATCSRSALRNAGVAAKRRKKHKGRQQSEAGISVQGRCSLQVAGCELQARCSRRSTLAPRRTLLQIVGRFRLSGFPAFRLSGFPYFPRPSSLDAREHLPRAIPGAGAQHFSFSPFPPPPSRARFLDSPCREVF